MVNDLDSTMLIVGGVPQYFFDNLIIEQAQDLTRTIHSPQKEQGPVIKKDRPWEYTPYFTVNGSSVVRDNQTGEFKCWYENWHMDTEEVKRQGVLYMCFSSTCYARSDDGIHWTKPPLDYYEEDGRKTNVVLGDPNGFVKLESTTIFEDPLDPDPAKRFKMLLDHHINPAYQTQIANKVDEEVSKTRDGRDGLTEKVAVEMHYSPNGISWTPAGEDPRFGQHGNGLGDCYTVWIDEDTGIYHMMTRAAGMESIHYDKRRPRTDSFFPPHFMSDLGRMNKRRVFHSQSKDLIHWSRPQCVLQPEDLADNIDDSFYGMVQFRLGEIHIGMLNVLHEVSNTMDVYLAYSRDGQRWDVLNKHQPWLTTSPGSWDCRQVSVSSPPAEVDDEMYLFYGGANIRHDWWLMGLKEALDIDEGRGPGLVKYGLGLAKLRLDGYVSIDTGSVREGILITRALRTESTRLVINAACGPGGYVEAEVTDPDDHVLDGCSRSDCDAFSGDSTKATITWQGREDIPHGGALRLRIYMRNASLYSITFV